MPSLGAEDEGKGWDGNNCWEWNRGRVTEVLNPDPKTSSVKYRSDSSRRQHCCMESVVPTWDSNCGDRVTARIPGHSHCEQTHEADVKRETIYLQPLLLFSMASDAYKQTDRDRERCGWAFRALHLSWAETGQTGRETDRKVNWQKG